MVAALPAFLRTPGRRVLAGVLKGLGLVLVLFHWDWLRPALERYLSSTSGREVRAEHMTVTGLLSLHPTVTFRGVRVENAPWADTRQPMAIAGEVSFRFGVRSVSDDRTLISLVVLKDADVDIQRQANGLRNWRLRNPDDRGPPKVRVLSLQAQRTKLRFANRDPDREFDIRFTASAPAPATPANASGAPPANRIDARGTYRGAQFVAEALTGPVLTFRETGESFLVRGHAVSGATRLELDGKAADMFQRPLLDAQVRISGATLAQLHPFTLLKPANSRGYSFQAHVRKTRDEYHFNDLRGRIGETDLGGSVSHGVQGGRHHWRVQLKGAVADPYDLGSFFKGDRDIPIHCALARVDFSGGKGRVSTLLVETGQTRIEGAGAVNLREEKQDIVLVPHPKRPGLLTLGSSIRARGSFKHPAFEFHKGAQGAPAIASNARCPAKPAG